MSTLHKLKIILNQGVILSERIKFGSQCARKPFDALSIGECFGLRALRLLWLWPLTMWYTLLLPFFSAQCGLRTSTDPVIPSEPHNFFAQISIASIWGCKLMSSYLRLIEMNLRCIREAQVYCGLCNKMKSRIDQSSKN